MVIKILRSCSGGGKSFVAGKSYKTGKDFPESLANKLLNVPNTAEIQEPKKGSKNV